MSGKKEIPPPLKNGDKIGILSTARKITREELEIPINIIENFGYKVVLGKTIGAEDHQFAGSVHTRVADFQEMMNDSEIKAILCARGGYGTGQLLEHLDFSPLQHNPKWIIGYSDITALHLYLNKVLCVQSLHASMPLNFKDNSPEALKSLFQTLIGEKMTYHFPAHTFNKPGFVKGELIGGNLSVIYSMQGGIAEVDCKDKILFIEDLDEYLYHIDRMMLNLQLSGKLAEISGLIVGGMTDMNDNSIPFGKDAVTIIKDYCKAYNFPLAFNCPAGHLDDNRALLMGGMIELNIQNSETTLKFI